MFTNVTKLKDVHTIMSIFSVTYTNKTEDIRLRDICCAVSPYPLESARRENKCLDDLMMSYKSHGNVKSSPGGL